MTMEDWTLKSAIDGDGCQNEEREGELVVVVEGDEPFIYRGMEVAGRGGWAVDGSRGFVTLAYRE